MRLNDFLSFVSLIAKKNGLSQPYLVGGVPRDKILGILDRLNDIDVTSGDADVHALARLLAGKFQNSGMFKEFPDGHSSLQIKGSLKVDFSSNFKIPNVEKIVGKYLSELEQEVWSRDFTCNTILIPFDNLESVKDLTGRGIRDIQDKKLVTCLSPEVTLGLDHKRIIRILYLNAKLGFSIDGRVLDFVKKNPSLISDGVSPDYLSKKLKKTIDYKSPETISLIKDLGLAPYLPLKMKEFQEITNG